RQRRSSERQRPGLRSLLWARVGRVSPAHATGARQSRLPDNRRGRLPLVLRAAADVLRVRQRQLAALRARQRACLTRRAGLPAPRSRPSPTPMRPRLLERPALQLSALWAADTSPAVLESARRRPRGRHRLRPGRRLRAIHATAPERRPRLDPRDPPVRRRHRRRDKHPAPAHELAHSSRRMVDPGSPAAGAWPLRLRLALPRNERQLHRLRRRRLPLTWGNHVSPWTPFFSVTRALARRGSAGQSPAPPNLQPPPSPIGETELPTTGGAELGSAEP